MQPKNSSGNKYTNEIKRNAPYLMFGAGAGAGMLASQAKRFAGSRIAAVGMPIAAGSAAYLATAKATGTDMNKAAPMLYSLGGGAAAVAGHDAILRKTQGLNFKFNPLKRNVTGSLGALAGGLAAVAIHGGREKKAEDMDLLEKAASDAYNDRLKLLAGGTAVAGAGTAGLVVADKKVREIASGKIGKARLKAVGASAKVVPFAAGTAGSAIYSTAGAASRLGLDGPVGDAINKFNSKIGNTTTKTVAAGMAQRPLSMGLFNSASKASHAIEDVKDLNLIRKNGLKGVLQAANISGVKNTIKLIRR